MANIKFNVPCPSCAANLVIRSSAAVGRKMECPKCKYRFVVPQPPEQDDAPADEAATDTPAETGKGKKKKKEKAKAGNNKAMLGVLLGVLVLGGLGFAAWQIFGGDDKPVANNTGGGGSGGSGPGLGGVGPVPGGPGGPGAMNPGGAGNPSAGAGPIGQEDPDKEEQGGPAGKPPGPGGAPPAGPGVNPAAPKSGKPPKRRPVDPNSKDITNLLPGETQSVWHGRVADLEKTQLFKTFFSGDVRTQFKDSMKFDISNVREFVVAHVGLERNPFAVMQLTEDIAEADLDKMNLKAGNAINGREVRGIKSNAFITALSKSFSLQTLVEGALGTGQEAKPAAEKPLNLALCQFDHNTLIIGDKETVERFLNDLDAITGYPPYKTELTDPPVMPAAPSTTPGGPGAPGALEGTVGAPGSVGPPMGPTGPMGPNAPPRGPGGRGTDAQGPGAVSPLQPSSGGIGQGAGAGPAGPRGPGGNPPPPRVATYTSNPTFRTIDSNLKRAFNELESEDRDPQPALTYAEVVAQRSLRDLPSLGGADTLRTVTTILGTVKILGFALLTSTDEKMTATVYLDHPSDEAAKTAAKERIPLLLTALKTFATKLPFAVNDYTSGQQPGGSPNGPGYPGGPGGYPGPGGAGYPGPGGPGGSAYPGPGGPGGPGGSGYPGPGGPGGPGGSPYPGPGGPSGKSASNRRERDDELAQGKPGIGALPPPPSPGGQPGGPAGPGPAGPGSEGEGTPGMYPGPAPAATSSHIDIRLSGTVVMLDVEFLFPSEATRTMVADNLARSGAQFRGRMAIASGEVDVFALGKAVVKATADNKEFPSGALERDATTLREGLPYPPAERVSFFADLLPYLGKANLRNRIQERKFAWHSLENLPAAEEWVPAFLNPNYPQSAWRATSDLGGAKGVSLGATNYIGVAGLGLDAARYDSNAPEGSPNRKKVGLITYEDGAKLNDCPDGLSNTMLMLQLPPTSPRPWIAGGGATLMGIDESDNALKPFVTAQPGGQRGTMVLMGDGSVRMVREGTNPAVFRSMATRAGADGLPDFDKLAPKLTPATNELRAEPVRVDPPKPEPKTEGNGK